MTKSGSLSFGFDFKTYELSLLELPIEVRKPNMALVARTLSSNSIDVEPGEYFVTATLPAGQELAKLVKVEKGEPAKVILTPEIEDESPHETHEMRHFFLNQETILPKPTLERLDGSPVQGTLRCFAGNFLQGTFEKVNDLLPSFIPPTDTATAEIVIHGRNRTILAQLLQSNLPPLNIALPVGGEENLCTLVITRQPDGSCNIDAQLEHRVAELLLRYREKGLLEQVAVTSNSSALDAKQLLFEKKRDPVAAAVGAYTLLRFGKLEYLHDWTANLMDWFAWLPDGIAIRGEHLARMGKHDEALDVFIDLERRGLPLFSDGVTYVQNRLQYYDALGEKDFKLEKLAQARKLLMNLQGFVPYVDFGKPILTFTGINPQRPDNQPFDLISLGDGLAVSSIFA